MTIPTEFKNLADSPELYDQSESIGTKFGLHIDQVGELDAEIRDVLSGVSSSKDFSKHIIERLEIDKDLADKIVAEVNAVIFGTLRAKLRSNETDEQKNSAISSLERIGKFNIESSQNENIQQDGHWREVTQADREKILAGVEDGENYNDSQNGDTEPLVDYLLQNPIGQREHKVLDHVPDNLPIVETTPIPEDEQSSDNMAISTPTQRPTMVTPTKTIPDKPIATPTKTGFDPYKEPIT